MSEKTMRAGLSVSHPLPGAYPDAYRQTIDRYYPRECAGWRVGPQDVRISQPDPGVPGADCRADAAPCGGAQFRRAAELIAIPDERILAIYNALRPFRSSQAELLAIADELEHTWHATVNAAFVRESAEVYQQRHKLRKGS
jgi:glycerol dehydratase small subunit